MKDKIIELQDKGSNYDVFFSEKEIKSLEDKLHFTWDEEKLIKEHEDYKDNNFYIGCIGSRLIKLRRDIGYGNEELVIFRKARLKINRYLDK